LANSRDEAASFKPQASGKQPEEELRAASCEKTAGNSRFWLLASGFWLLASGFWLLASGFWLLANSLKAGEVQV
jgi:hypothetical protein